MVKVFIVGAGGMGRETLDIYEALGRGSEVEGFLEENCQKNGTQLNNKPVHDIAFLKQYEQNKPLLIGAIGSTRRKRLLTTLEKGGFGFDSVVHPSAVRSKWAEIGEGSIISPGAVINCQVKIGRHVIVNCGVILSHDIKIGEFSTISPGAKVMGFANIGSEVFIGANATIVDRVTVGRGAIVAAGAVVIDDVPEMTLVAGVPAVKTKVYRSIDEKPW